MSYTRGCGGQIRCGAGKAGEHLRGNDPEKRRDLSQDIPVQLWRSFAAVRCALFPADMGLWVAHHVAVLHVLRERRGLFLPLSEPGGSSKRLPERAGGQPAVDRALYGRFKRR